MCAVGNTGALSELRYPGDAVDWVLPLYPLPGVINTFG
jgi:hypothetical protein